MAPASSAGPPASAMIGCEVRWRITSSPPGRMWSRKPIPLHIVPLGRKRPASCPSSSATRSWSAEDRGVVEALLVPHLGLGDRPRMAAVGRDCVSL